MKKTICTVYLIIQLIIVSLLLFAAGSTDYFIKREFSFPNVVYLIAGILLTALLCFFVTAFHERLQVFLTKRRSVVIPVTIILFFILALVICIGGFFFSDWDPAAVLYGVYGVLHGHPEDTGVTYFSNHPNNLMLVWVYLLILRMAGIFGTESVLVLVVFQCILSSLGALVFYRIMKDMTGDQVTAYTGLVVYEIWIVLSPWFIITYSDEVGLLIPLLILRLYQRLVQGEGSLKKTLFLSVTISALAAAGYMIKPQILLCFIAVLILMLSDDRAGEVRYRIITAVSCAALALLLAFVIKAAVIPSIGIATDSSKSFGMAHYFMMGLNDETDGVYSDEDTLFTDSYDTPEEKTRADLGLALDRIRRYGFIGLMDHSMKKTLVNFSDGLFAWGVDGNFFAGRALEDIGDIPETDITGVIWSFIRTDGAFHGRYSSLIQMIWVTVMALGLVCGIIMAKDLFQPASQPEESLYDCGTMIYAVMLTLIFLFVFELLFEAKARYLFIYMPYFLMAAVCGTDKVINNIKMRKITGDPQEME